MASRRNGNEVFGPGGRRGQQRAVLSGEGIIYAELVRYVPKTERAAWHEKAMAAAEQGDLGSIIELWLGAKEIARLAERLDRASDTQLESLSHYATEPAAERLSRTHPDVAARVFRALCMRIINAGKSKYYHVALSNLKKAQTCYQRAGWIRSGRR